MKTASLFILAAFLSFGRLVQAAGAPIDALQFIDRIQGTYQIDMAGGHIPTSQNNQAEVYADTEEGILTLPFCGTSGLCDPGYIEFTYAKTQATREELAPDHFVVELVTQYGAKTYRYTWESKAAQVTFTNYQYLVAGKVTQLVHQIHKVSP